MKHYNILYRNQEFSLIVDMEADLCQHGEIIQKWQFSGSNDSLTIITCSTNEIRFSQAVPIAVRALRWLEQFENET